MASRSVDVAVITETWLCNDIPSSTLDLPAYSVIKHDGSDGQSAPMFKNFTFHSLKQPFKS